MLEEDECYQLCNIVVGSYQGGKYLSFPKAGAEMTTIGDIGHVVVDDLAEAFTIVDGALVIGVLASDSYLACILCKSKVSTTCEKLGECTNWDCQDQENSKVEE